MNLKMKITAWVMSALALVGLGAGTALAQSATGTLIAGVGETVAESAFQMFLGVFSSAGLWLALVAILVLLWVVRWVLSMIRGRHR